MKITPTVWQTDEPCPSCGNELVLLDDGRYCLRAECRACGHNEPWTIEPLWSRQ
jgi:transcription elongation factor Elf1